MGQRPLNFCFVSLTTLCKLLELSFSFFSIVYELPFLLFAVFISLLSTLCFALWKEPFWLISYSMSILDLPADGLSTWQLFFLFLLISALRCFCLLFCALWLYDWCIVQADNRILTFMCVWPIAGSISTSSLLHLLSILIVSLVASYTLNLKRCNPIQLCNEWPRDLNPLCPH